MDVVGDLGLKGRLREAGEGLRRCGRGPAAREPHPTEVFIIFCYPGADLRADH